MWSNKTQVSGFMQTGSLTYANRKYQNPVMMCLIEEIYHKTDVEAAIRPKTQLKLGIVKAVQKAEQHHNVALMRPAATLTHINKINNARCHSQLSLLLIIQKLRIIVCI